MVTPPDPTDPYQIARWLLALSAEALAPRSLWLSPVNGGVGLWVTEGPSTPPRSVARPLYATTVDADEAVRSQAAGGWSVVRRVAERIAPALAMATAA